MHLSTARAPACGSVSIFDLMALHTTKVGPTDTKKRLSFSASHLPFFAVGAIGSYMDVTEYTGMELSAIILFEIANNRQQIA